MFRTRLISGILLMAVTIALMVYGSYALFWVVTGVSLIGLFELYRTAGMEKTPPAVIGYLSSIVIDILILDNGFGYLLMWLVATLMVMMACYCVSKVSVGSDDYAVFWADLRYGNAFLCFQGTFSCQWNFICLAYFYRRMGF